MKKILLSIFAASMFNVSAASLDENKLTNYFSDRSVVVQDLNQEIRLHGGLERIASLADKNDGHTNYLLGQMYRMGIVFDQDSVRALSHLTKASKNGSPEAAYILGMHLIGEDPIMKNARQTDELSRQGFGWIKIAAESGFTEAQFFVGQGHLHGKFYAKDIDLAMFWLSKAAQSGHVRAGSIRSELVYKTEQMKKSFESIHKRAINGDDSALVELGMLYEEGYIVQQDYGKAYRLYESAAKLGNKKGKKLAMQLEAVVN